MKNRNRNETAAPEVSAKTAHDFFSAVSADAEKCKTVDELSENLGARLPKGVAEPVKRMLKNRAAVEALLVRFTGDRSIGKKLDTIYGEQRPSKGRKQK